MARHKQDCAVATANNGEPTMEQLTERELRAITVALARALAGEPETDDEDTEGMERAAAKVARLLALRAQRKNLNTRR